MTLSDRTRALPLAVAAALIVAGCMTRSPVPVDERAPALYLAPPLLPPPVIVREPEARPQLYVVKRGETLAQIALDHGLDYRELAAWNNIENPNLIRVGQLLALSPPGQAGPGGVVTAPLVNTPSIAPSNESRALMATPGHGNTATLKSEPRAMKLPYSEQALAQLERASAPAAPLSAPAPTRAAVPGATPAGQPPQASAPGAAAPPSATAQTPANVATAPHAPRTESARVPEIDDAKVEWAWPTSGKVIAGFSESANLKGIDIGGKAGQPVLASAAGRVVYAGAGLRGYGKLVIVKHNNTYLSAYAHNREIMVKEGQQVSKGQKIGEMGDTDADQVKLHFEIRRLGKPIDPAKFLPPA